MSGTDATDSVCPRVFLGGDKSRLSKKPPPGTRVFAVVDVFDAPTSCRPYKEPFEDIEAWQLAQELPCKVNERRVTLNG